MLIYAICLAVGLVFTLVSVVFGHFFGGHDAHVEGSGGHAEVGADSSDMPGMSIFSPTVLASFVTAFGGFGLVFSQFQATKSTLISTPLSVFCALLIAGGLYKFLNMVFRHTQSSSESKVGRLVGIEANVITPIAENGVGEIAYVVGGSRYTAAARAEKGTAVASGQTVKITRIVGTQFYVEASN